MGFLKKETRKSRVLQIPVGSIIPNPQQPRHNFDPDTLLSLSQSIRHNGILQPLTVRLLKTGEYELVSGERRLRAAIMAGYTMVPCITVTLDDNQSAVMSLLENLQREDLNFFDEAQGIAKLVEHWGMTQEDIAVRLGKSQSTIANKLRLLRISKGQRERIVKLGLTERHARALLRLDEEKRSMALDEIEKRSLNVEETERCVENMLFPPKVQNERKSFTVIKDIRIFFNTISNAVDVMKRSGIDATAQRQEYDDHFEYTVRIPKAQECQNKKAMRA